MARKNVNKLDLARALSAEATSLFQVAYNGMDAAETLLTEHNDDLIRQINALVDEQAATLLAQQQAKDSKTQLATFLPKS